MRYWRMVLGAIGLSVSAFAVAATNSTEEPVRTEMEAPPSTINEPFWCSAWCTDHWFRVSQCYEPQTCCGFAICEIPTGVNQCCASNEMCNYDIDDDPPTLPDCIYIGS